MGANSALPPMTIYGSRCSAYSSSTGVRGATGPRPGSVGPRPYRARGRRARQGLRPDGHPRPEAAYWPAASTVMWPSMPGWMRHQYV